MNSTRNYIDMDHSLYPSITSFPSFSSPSPYSLSSCFFSSFTRPCFVTYTVLVNQAFITSAISEMCSATCFVVAFTFFDILLGGIWRVEWCIKAEPSSPAMLNDDDTDNIACSVLGRDYFSYGRQHCKLLRYITSHNLVHSEFAFMIWNGYLLSRWGSKFDYYVKKWKYVIYLYTSLQINFQFHTPWFRNAVSLEIHIFLEFFVLCSSEHIQNNEHSSKTFTTCTHYETGINHSGSTHTSYPCYDGM